MAKFFIDTEFIEGFHKPLFGKKRHFIDLISIGIVCEDGREYFSVSEEYNYKDADQWVKENVIIPMYSKGVSGDLRNRLDASNFHKYLGKPNKQIAQEIIDFVSRDESNKELGRHVDITKESPEFYAYYADYDWVVFCSLFGRMIDLPVGFPMYCKDLKQSLDLLAVKANIEPGAVKYLPNYPTQENEHSALDDAKWNFKLFKFLETFK